MRTLRAKFSANMFAPKVVPECDAYVISKLAGLAATRSNLVNGNKTKPYDALCKLINEVQSVVGYDEELVAFVDSYMYAALQNSNEISRMITVSDFKQGDITLKVKSINGVAIIPVVSERMKTAYTFNAANAGGFTRRQMRARYICLYAPRAALILLKRLKR